jgi:hypothetical protein
LSKLILDAFQELFVPLCDTLEEMRDNRDQKYSPSLVTDASHFYNLIVKFEFVATFVLSKLILDELLPVVQLNGTIKKYMLNTLATRRLVIRRLVTRRLDNSLEYQPYHKKWDK